MSLLAPVRTPSSLLFQGNTEPAPAKDCVLIIDHETGELTLERWQKQMEALSFWDVCSVWFFSFFHSCGNLDSLQGDEQHPSEKDATWENRRNGIIRRALLQSIWSKTNPCESLRSQSQPYKSIWGEPEQDWKKWNLHINIAFRWSQTLCIRGLQTDNRGSAILVALGQLLHRWTFHEQLKLLDLRFILFLQTKKASPKHATATHHLADSLSPINSAKSRCLWISLRSLKSLPFSPASQSGRGPSSQVCLDWNVQSNLTS